MARLREQKDPLSPPKGGQELTLADVSVEKFEIPPDEEDLQDEEFQKRANEAQEPMIPELHIRDFQVGDLFEAFHPYYRIVRVIRTNGVNSCIVQASVRQNVAEMYQDKLREYWQTREWLETWAHRNIEWDEEDGRGKMRHRTKPHVIVTEEKGRTKPEMQRSPLISTIDGPWVMVRPLKDIKNAIRDQERGKGPVQSPQQADGPRDEQGVQEQGGGEEAPEGPVRERPRRKKRGRPRGSKSARKVEKAAQEVA